MPHAASAGAVDAWRRCPSIAESDGMRSDGLVAEYICTSVPRRAEVEYVIFAVDRIVFDRADEIFAPLLDRADSAVDPIKMRLQVAIGAGDVADFDAEEDVAVVVGPMRAGFLGFILGDSAGCCGLQFAGEGAAATYCQINVHRFRQSSYFSWRWLMAIADEGEFAAVRRGDQVVHAQRRCSDGAGAGSEIGFLFGLPVFFHFGGRGRMLSQGSREVEGEDRVTAFGGAVLHDIFPCFLVVVFLRLRPRMARGEVDRLRICRPGESVDVFFSLRHGESFAAVG